MVVTRKSIISFERALHFILFNFVCAILTSQFFVSICFSFLNHFCFHMLYDYFKRIVLQISIFNIRYVVKKKKKTQDIHHGRRHLISAVAPTSEYRTKTINHYNITRK